MMKSATSHLDQEDEAEDYDSSYREEPGKLDGKSSELKRNKHRSKHSETEQRRRSKINERFQILRDLIPQNDQKRDKASFLLEVIEYIQFLHEKLQMYEASYQGWSQEPTKLIPWKNHQVPAEGLTDHSQVMKDGSEHDGTAVLTNVQNSLESDLGTAAIYKALDHLSGSTNHAVPFDMQMQSKMFSAVGRGGVPTQSLQETVSDAENMACQLQSQLWQGQPCSTECALPTNTLNGQERLTSESGSISISSDYSQGMFNTLTQALQSSGVDLSQTSISVQIDVGKRANGGTTAVGGTSDMASSSKDQENQYMSNKVMEQSGIGSCMENSKQACKRLRTEKS